MSRDSSLLSLLSQATSFLAKSGIPTPRLDADVLLAHTLKIRKTELYLRLRDSLPSQHHAAFWKKIERRAQREPLQYITGVQEFWSLAFSVAPHVLIPRPETELLVEAALGLLASASVTAPGILDLGTGSGCLAVALAVELPQAQIWAYDISSDALAVARQNAARHGVHDRITFVLGDIQKDVAGLPDVPCGIDLIVTNPPYIAQPELSTLQPEVRDWEPRQALDGGRDGLDFYRRLLQDCPMLLRSGGWLIMEIGHGQSEEVMRLARGHAILIDCTLKPDYAGLPRVVVVRRK